MTFVNFCIFIIIFIIHIIGSEININKALKLIRIKFPERAYPEFTLDCVTPMLEGSPMISQLFKV